MQLLSLGVCMWRRPGITFMIERNVRLGNQRGAMTRPSVSRMILCECVCVSNSTKAIACDGRGLVLWLH